MERRKLLLTAALLILIVVLLAGCAPGNERYTENNPAGFFWGVWHGWIAPFSLVIGLFNPHVHIYEVNNTGWWYEFGFYISIISGFGGISLFRKKNKDD